ncbi:MAG: 16S rRNA (guanine(966)-N(2))-methyltransferase RsmD [Gemmatimonadota bacterium]|nr:16S rRNA (guanine(966)-N(2))-methyltransferase RsmD [Gemmatimonadota bacterium]
MRIIAGELRGRRLRATPDRRVRPTTDRVREAWFSILGPDVHGARVLDLFAGSGALGLEALSRGATHATFVELSQPSLAALRDNVTTLGLETRVAIRRADALRFVAKLASGAFDLAFADPPYATGQAEALRDQWRAAPFARILGIEHPASLDLAGTDTRRYGNTALTFFHRP